MLKKSSERLEMLYWAGITSILAVIILMVMGCVSLSGITRNAAELIPTNTKTQTISTAGGRNTPTATRFVHATSTRTPLQPLTPTPTPTPLLAYIFLPAVANLGNPISIPTGMPPLTTPDNNSANPTPLPSATQAPFTEKTILVDISDQRVYAYAGGKLVFSFIASTGRKNLTRAGHYRILDKYPRAYSDPWGFWMPYWMGIYYAGYNLENGFHSLPVLSNGTKLWGNKIGKPITYGCVVLMPNDMKKLYRWAGIGTAVVIQK